MKSNALLLTLFPRIWHLLLAFLVTNWAAMTEMHFKCLGKWVHDPTLGGIWAAATPMEWLGPIVGWGTPIVLFVVILTVVILHFFFRDTIDADIHSGQYIADWRGSTPFQRILTTLGYFAAVIITLGFIFAGIAAHAEPIPVDQVRRWDEAVILPQKRIALDCALGLYRRTKSRYEAIENMRTNGVPAPVLFCLHYRESDNSFRCHAHEGSSLQHRTRDEPKGRPLHPEPPYTFEQSAEDAYYIFEHPTLDRINWRSKQAALDKMESFNGYGYRAKGIPAPYLFAGTSIYHGGKYVRDGVFSRTAMDQQLGCVAILKHMQNSGITLPF